MKALTRTQQIALELTELNKRLNKLADELIQLEQQQHTTKKVPEYAFSKKRNNK
jgi:hypothetical protein